MVCKFRLKSLNFYACPEMARFARCVRLSIWSSTGRTSIQTRNVRQQARSSPDADACRGARRTCAGDPQGRQYRGVCWNLRFNAYDSAGRDLLNGQRTLRSEGSGYSRRSTCKVLSEISNLPCRGEKGDVLLRTMRSKPTCGFQ